jgi:NADH-quinone oxidoreductase subunit E
MECIGACGTAPAMLVNKDFHDNLTAQKIDKILEKYK